jgi:hypothetical protein
MVETQTTAIINIAPSQVENYLQLQRQIEKLLIYAEGRSILNDEHVKIATEDLSVISKLGKAIESMRKEYVSPIKDHLKSVNSQFDILTDPLDKADKTTRNKILAYRVEQERKRKEIEEINRMREEAARKEAALNEGVITESAAPVPVPEAQPKTVHTDMGNLGTQKVWKFEVEDFEKLPNEYKVADLVKIGKVVRAGVNIPGVKAWQEESLRVNTK